MSNYVNFINFAINVFIILIFVRIIFSWFRVDFDKNTLFRFVFEITEPFLSPFRKIGSVGFLDFSPLIVIILLEMLRKILTMLL